LSRIAFVTLGCPKNLVDSEGALGELIDAGHETVGLDTSPDVIVLNTCGFIESAREESVGAVLDAIGRKERGECRAVVVIGCLSQRYGGELAEAEPGIDAVLGVDHAGRLAETIARVLDGRGVVEVGAVALEWREHPWRVRSTPPWTAYLKISDGCDNRCSYCAIPDIRGRFRSRPERLIIEEARRMADEGVREIILIGQDVTRYGEDIGRGDALPSLVEKLAAIDSLRWVRLMYCYPTRVSRELIRVIADCEKVVKYLDLPLQHGDDAILAAMNRRGTVADYLRLIDDLREACPEIALRSTFIVGFPGERRETFENLARFVERVRFDRMGVFEFSPEDGTPAFGLKPRVSARTSARRYDRLMTLARSISREKNESLIGRSLEVLIEETDGVAAYGRSYRDAPEIDGVVQVRGAKAGPGKFVQTRVIAAGDYDLEAVQASPEEK